MAAAIDLGKHTQQWAKALAQGNHQALAATTLQIAGDGILVGTNTWGAKHTTSIINQILKNPTELRALAWAEASPRLLSIAARANLVGLIGTALQLVGEGLRNYFNLDELQKWLQASAWGRSICNAVWRRGLERAGPGWCNSPPANWCARVNASMCTRDCPACAPGKWTVVSCICRPIVKPAI